MNSDLPQPARDQLDPVFDSLDAGAAEALLSAMAAEGVDPARDRAMGDLIRQTLAPSVPAAGSTDSVPEMPAAVRESWESARRAIASRQTAPERQGLRSMDRFRRVFSSLATALRMPEPVLALTAIVLLAAVALTALWRMPGATGGEFALLTPGPVTGFREPVIVWTASETMGPVSVTVADEASGAVVVEKVASASPFALTTGPAGAALTPGGRYRLTIRAGEKESGKILADRVFALVPEAEAEIRPARESTLDGVVDQCRRYVSANRHADAWMLWSQLTPEEKADPRLQALKGEIMARISAG